MHKNRLVRSETPTKSRKSDLKAKQTAEMQLPAINTKERSSEVSKEEIRTGPMSRKLLMTRPQQ